MSDGTMEYIDHLEKLLERCISYVEPEAGNYTDSDRLLKEIKNTLERLWM